MVRISRARSLPKYKLELWFTDGSSGIVDLSDLVGKGVFSAWNDPVEFAKVTVNPRTRTVEWPGGIDLDPNVLYQDATGRALPESDAAA